MISQILHHFVQCTHSAVRIYQPAGILESYLGNHQSSDPVLCDPDFAATLCQFAIPEYPRLYLEVYPVYYAVIANQDHIYLLGPVSVDYTVTQIEGLSIGSYLAKKHHTGEQKHRIAYCEYTLFCEEVLLLFNLLTQQQMGLLELNEKNFMQQNLSHQRKQRLSKIYFHYQEQEKMHNPYDQEIRELKSIREGDIEGLKNSLNEIHEGEYGILSQNPLRSVINLAIVSLALSARAAIDGGLLPEESFSLNDSYILQCDAASSIGEVLALTRQAKLEYAQLVQGKKQRLRQNPKTEAAKRIIFKNMHQKIVVQTIAKELDITPEYLSFLFKQEEGITINDYIMREKIRLSQNLLIYSDYSISDIGYYFGFCSQSHYGKVFKKWKAITPKQFRDQFGVKEFITDFSNSRDYFEQKN